jgi:hypothetical protein
MAYVTIGLKKKKKNSYIYVYIHNPRYILFKLPYIYIHTYTCQHYYIYNPRYKLIQLLYIYTCQGYYIYNILDLYISTVIIIIIIIITIIIEIKFFIRTQAQHCTSPIATIETGLIC